MRIKAWAVACLAVSLAWAMPSSSAPPGWPASLTIGTASPGGVYYDYGREMAAILTEGLGIPVTAQSTQGSAQNAVLLEDGTIQLALFTTGTALRAWNGTETTGDRKQLRSMRALLPMYGTPFQFVTFEDTGIHSFADLANKRIGDGPAGGGSGTFGPLVFEALAIPATLRHGAWSMLGNQMRSRQLDAMMAAIGAPSPVIAELEASQPLAFIELTPSEIATVHKAIPELEATVMPANTYPSQKQAYNTIGYYNFAVAHKDLPDDLAYAIVKAFFANHDRMIKTSSSARESVADNAKLITAIPFHPGAARYYREIGVEIPKRPASTN
ncbi:MAG TPA: TAXI family TRAP transporter solute-binding subunit [Stellaceae bacterium]